MLEIIYTNFRAQLLSLTAVTDIIGDRVAFNSLPADHDVPAIVLTMSGGSNQAYYRDSFGLSIFDIQISLFSKSPTDLLVMYDAIKTEFHGFSGLLNNNADALVAPCSISQPIGIPQDDDVYGVVCEIVITYNGDAV